MSAHSPRCENCLFWLRGYTEADGGYGFCSNEDTAKNPTQINGSFYEGDAGLETYGGSICDNYQDRPAPNK